MNRSRPAAAVAGLIVSVLVAVFAPVGLAAPAGAAQGSGNPVLAVSPTTIKPGATVTVTGTDYLVPPHAPGVSVFGGVYVIFGWVRPGAAWGPSARNSNNNNGVFGTTYSYRGDGGDASTRDDGSGTTRLVAFTTGGESGTATDFHMDDNGNWTTTLRIPSASYQYKDLSGVTRTVDCRKVQCGVFTIGAHGKASSTNERFVPVKFTALPPTPTTRPQQQGGTTPTTAPPVTAPTAGPVVTPDPNDSESNGGGVPTPTTSPVTKPSTPVKKPPAPTSTTAKPKATTTTTDAGAVNAPGEKAAGEPVALEPTASIQSDDSSPAPWIALGAVVLAAIAAGAWFLLRRRSGVSSA